jgi:hypothetical protein
MKLIQNKNYYELPRMDIYAPNGTRVMFDSLTAGYPYDQEKIKLAGLVVGRIYTVNFTVVHRNSTDVYLNGFLGFFNSVCFGQLKVV